MLFEVIINILEATCIFLLASLVIFTWKVIDKDLLKLKYFKLIYLIVFILFISTANSIQIITQVVFGKELDKFISVGLSIIIISLIMSSFLSKFQKVHIYIFAMILGLTIVAMSDIIVSGIGMIFVDENIIFGNYYKVFCIIAIIFKYLILICLTLIYKPKFFIKSKYKIYRLSKYIG